MEWDGKFHGMTCRHGSWEYHGMSYGHPNVTRQAYDFWDDPPMLGTSWEYPWENSNHNSKMVKEKHCKKGPCMKNP
jgi:hypothetical protein